MAKKRRKKSIFKSAFYRVYFALVLLALIAIGVGYGWLRGVLADYESAQPIHVAEEVAHLFETSDYDAICALDSNAAQLSGEDRQFYADSLRQLTEDKALAWTETFSGSEDARNYAVTLDGERFASFTLVPSGQTTRRGNALWKLGSLATNVTLRQSDPEPEAEAEEPEPPAQTFQCRITAPRGYSVAVDGVALSAENAMVTDRPLFESGFLPEGVENPAMSEYVFDAASETPQIAVTDETGAAVEVAASGDRALTWSCAMKEDEAFREQYGQAAISLGRHVAKYTSGDAGKGSIQKICAKNSPAAEIFENLSNRYKTPHTSVSFQNEAVSECYALSENCYTCHVSFDFVMQTKSGEMVYPTEYTFCVISQGGSGKLYNLTIT